MIFVVKEVIEIQAGFISFSRELETGKTRKGLLSLAKVHKMKISFQRAQNVFSYHIFLPHILVMSRSAHFIFNKV